jgi:phosphorylcholine metabolism protein LicD
MNKPLIILLLLLIIVILVIFFILQRVHEKFENSDPHDKYTIEMSPKLTKEDIEDLKRGHKIMTNMFKEFDRICRKHNLKYWCIGGTLIGAIRHKGWIPWDGDIDVGMTETDYKQLQTVIQHELPEGMWFQDKTVDKYYKSDIGKVRYLDSIYKDYKDQSWHNGLQLDIFIYNEQDNIIKRNNEPINYKIHPLKETYFENIKVYIPFEYTKYLIHHFGEKYMEFPEINNRYPHEGRFGLFCPDWVKKKYPYLYK